jgi:hypothetical protein
LPIAKYTQHGDQILYREFWEYDDGCNLIREIADDGTGSGKEDLTDVTQRTITSYELRQEQPFLHMPEWTEESYWGEGQRHVLTRTHHVYDAYGNVCQDTVYDAHGQLAYQLQRTYDIEGYLLSETNALGQERSALATSRATDMMPWDDWPKSRETMAVTRLSRRRPLTSWDAR